MRILRVALVIGLACGLSGCGSSSPIVGTWEGEGERGHTVEFTSDGRILVKEHGRTLEGKYQLSGNKLTITLMDGTDREEKQATVKSITESELVLEFDGRTLKFKKSGSTSNPTNSGHNIFRQDNNAGPTGVDMPAHTEEAIKAKASAPAGPDMKPMEKSEAREAPRKVETAPAPEPKKDR